MKTHNIPIESFASRGKISLSTDGGELLIASKRVIDKNAGCVSVPSSFRLPLRIDMVLKANSSDFRLQTGKGWIHFSAPINHSGGGIRRADILTGKEETPKHDYDNDLPLNEYVNLSVIYGGKAMWVEMNGKYCYSTLKAPYLSEKFTDGLDVGIGCGKGVELTIKSFRITEYENDEPDIPEEIADLPELSPFEWYLKSLPHELRDEAVKTDEYLLKDMKSSLKFRRSIDKYGNVTYASPCGFEYSMLKYEAGRRHETSWLQNPDKPDYTSRILKKIAESSPELADKLFSKFWICIQPKCKNCSIIEYKGESKETCYSIIAFEWRASEFEDVRKVAAAAYEAVKAAIK